MELLIRLDDVNQNDINFVLVRCGAIINDVVVLDVTNPSSTPVFVIRYVVNAGTFSKQSGHYHIATDGEHYIHLFYGITHYFERSDFEILGLPTPSRKQVHQFISEFLNLSIFACKTIKH